MTSFSEEFCSDFARLCRWRRDVRRFRAAPVSETIVEELLALADLSPSVGNSQPWRWVRVISSAARSEVQESFRAANEMASSRYRGNRATLYATLKLEGLKNAPVQFGVFCETATQQGFGLGRQSMPEALEYSVVCAINTLWLAARCFGLGVGWVSIVDPVRLQQAFSVPASWKLIAYLCIGWPEEEHLDPELVRAEWQHGTDLASRIVYR